MLHCDLSQKEQHRRKEIAEHTRPPGMLLTELPIDSQDETSIMGRYRDYYLQISFSELHPLRWFVSPRRLPNRVPQSSAGSQTI